MALDYCLLCKVRNDLFLPTLSTQQLNPISIFSPRSLFDPEALRLFLQSDSAKSRYGNVDFIKELVHLGLLSLILRHALPTLVDQAEILNPDFFPTYGFEPDLLLETRIPGLSSATAQLPGGASPPKRKLEQVLKNDVAILQTNQNDIGDSFHPAHCAKPSSNLYKRTKFQGSLDSLSSLSSGSNSPFLLLPNEPCDSARGTSPHVSDDLVIEDYDSSSLSNTTVSVDSKLKSCQVDNLDVTFVCPPQRPRTVPIHQEVEDLILPHREKKALSEPSVALNNPHACLCNRCHDFLLSTLVASMTSFDLSIVSSTLHGSVEVIASTLTNIYRESSHSSSDSRDALLSPHVALCTVDSIFAYLSTLQSIQVPASLFPLSPSKALYELLQESPLLRPRSRSDVASTTSPLVASTSLHPVPQEHSKKLGFLKKLFGRNKKIIPTAFSSQKEAKTLLVFGGSDAQRGSASFECLHLNDPGSPATCSEQWSVVSEVDSPLQAHYGFAACRIGNSVLIAGGRGPKAISSAHRFDLLTCSWSPLPSLNRRRCHSTGINYNDQFYVFGGECNRQIFADGEVYHEKEKKWTLLPCASVCRTGSSAVVYKNSIILIGGFNEVNLQACESFDPINYLWTPFPSLSRPRSGSSAVVVNDYIVLVGGKSTGDLALASFEIFNPSLNSWQVFDDVLRIPRLFSSVSLLDHERLIVIGGKDSSFYRADRIAETEIVDLRLPSLRSEYGPSLNVPRVFASSFLIERTSVLENSFKKI